MLCASRRIQKVAAVNSAQTPNVSRCYRKFGRSKNVRVETRPVLAPCFSRESCCVRNARAKGRAIILRCSALFAGVSVTTFRALFS
eukprot:17108-Pleurochrysis_carterae.AAC.1